MPNVIACVLFFKDTYLTYVIIGSLPTAAGDATVLNVIALPLRTQGVQNVLYRYVPIAGGLRVRNVSTRYGAYPIDPDNLKSALYLLHTHTHTHITLVVYRTLCTVYNCVDTPRYTYRRAQSICASSKLTVAETAEYLAPATCYCSSVACLHVCKGPVTPIRLHCNSTALRPLCYDYILLL